jgi:hypothetical protein
MTLAWLGVYTGRAVDNRPIVWLRGNIRHLEQDHPERMITRREVEEVLEDSRRVESTEVRAKVTYHTVIGITTAARILVVVWVDHPAGRLPVHARQAGRRAARRYYS